MADTHTRKGWALWFRRAALVGAAFLTGCTGGWHGSPKRPATASEPAAMVPAATATKIDQRADLYGHFTAGIVYDVREEPKKADAEFNAAVLADPSQIQLAVELAQRYLQNREPRQAVEILTRASRQPHAGGQVFGWLGEACAQANDVPAAIAAYREAIKRLPQSIVGYHGLAQLYLRAKQTNEALGVLEAGAAQKRVGAAFLVDLAGFYIAAERTHLLPGDITKPRSLALLDRAARLNPTEPQVLQRLAEAYKALGELKRATTLYEDLVRSHPPDSPTGRLALHEQLFQLYLRAGDATNATRHLEAIKADYPSNPQVHLLLGALCSDEKKFAEAEQHFETALLLDPSLEPAYYDLAGAQLALRNPEAAWDTIQKARAQFKVGFLIEMYSGLVLAAEQKYAEALNHYGAAELHAKVNEPERLNDFFYFQVGAANERAGHYDEAEKDLRKCLELAPDNAEALNYLGYMWADRGVKLDEAETMIRKALKLEPENGAYLDSMAWLLLKQGKPGAALDYQLRALKFTDPPDATVFDHLGDIYAALGRQAEAQNAWQKSLAVEPNPVVARKLQPATGPR